MLKQTPPKGDTYYKGRAQNYEKRRLKQEWWHVEQREMKSLLEGLPRNLKVVDIPFGTGRFVPFYAELGHEIHGLDASGDMIEAARATLGKLYDKCSCTVGDAAALPYENGAFDLVVSTRFLRDIVTFGMAKQMLAEMARVTSKYAILQLGNSLKGTRMPADDEVMGGNLSRAGVDKLLKSHGLKVRDRRLVKSDEEVGEIHHILCEKT
ncbi:MAG: class I SAM-dependent methyltransferase [Pseudorhodobacter sp.]